MSKITTFKLPSYFRNSSESVNDSITIAKTKTMTAVKSQNVINAYNCFIKMLTDDPGVLIEYRKIELSKEF